MTRGQPDDSESGLAQRAGQVLERIEAEPLGAGLYLVATPIGNLADITLRALSVLARADVIYCEDTRHSRTLVSHFAIGTPLRPYHEHNADEQRPRVMAELVAGKRVALISDAGTPLVSDPGFKLVRDALAAGHAVHSIPGASAVLTALTTGGLPTDAFFFGGFLPAREAARRSRIRDLAAIPGTLVFFESPSRAAETLADLAEILGSRPAAIARELTKLYENVQRGRLDDLAAEVARSGVKGEVVLLVGPPEAAAAGDDLINEKLGAALESMSLRDAAAVVAELLSVPKSRVYDLGLAMRRDSYE